MKLLASFLVSIYLIWCTTAFAPLHTNRAITHSQTDKPPSFHVLSAQSSGPFNSYRLDGENEQSIQPTLDLLREEADRRQLLGMPKASAATETTEKWKIRLQLTKPITWVPLVAAVMCGAAASGNYHWMWNPFDPNDRDILLGLQDASRGLLTMILSGPFMEGYCQTINDWYDKDVDAINEPYRPIPSGAISEAEVMEQIYFLAIGSLLLAGFIDMLANHSFPVVLLCAAIGTFAGYAYSAPPFRLKQNGWSGDITIGLCYITLPWLCGHAAFGELDRPEFWLLPMIYSLSGISAAIVNDFKSVEGDREFGIDSIPAMYGIDVAKWICAIIQIVPQLIISAYLYSIGEDNYALILLGFILPQLYFIRTLLLADPVSNDTKFQMLCQPFSSFGLVTTAICMGQRDWGSLV